MDNITALTKELLKYSLTLTYDEFVAVRRDIELQAQSSLDTCPTAKVLFTSLLDNMEKIVYPCRH